LQEQRVIQRDLTGLSVMQRLLIEMNQRSELIWREIIRQWNVEMQHEELECPNLFFLTFGKSTRFNPKNWVSQEFQLYLVFQRPEGPHQVGDGNSLRAAREWWTTMSPWLNRLTTLLKVGISLTTAVGDVIDEIGIGHIKNHIALIEEITKDLPLLPWLDTLDSAVPETHFQHEQQVIGPALRALHSFLIQAEPSKIWGGLDKTLTPDGNILWLFEHHRLQYSVKPLSQQYFR
jgi:internalin A